MSLLIDDAPAAAGHRLEIAVLGPLRVTVDGVALAHPALRRARVRTLLAVLVVHGTVARERAVDLLWPDLGAEAGARNLRVTLTYLRQLLEPARSPGTPSPHLRADGASITLVRSPALVVDLWELERLVAEARQRCAPGDDDRRLALLEAATAHGRGEPLTDLAPLADHQHEIEHVRLLLLESLLEVAQLRLAAGDAARAVLAAERALALDPYDERAHRLALTAAVELRNPRRAAAVARRTVGMLDDLGVAPEPATAALLAAVTGLGAPPTAGLGRMA